MALSDGLYDLLLTEGLARSLATLDPGSAEVLSLKGGAPELPCAAVLRCSWLTSCTTKRWNSMTSTAQAPARAAAAGRR